MLLDDWVKGGVLGMAAVIGDRATSWVTGGHVGIHVAASPLAIFLYSIASAPGTASLWRIRMPKCGWIF